MNAIIKSFAFIRDAEATAEVKNCVVVVQGEFTEELFQFLKSLADLWWIGFVGLCVGLVQLIQNCFTIAITEIKGMSIYVSFQLICDLIYDGTSWLAGASPEAR